MASLPLDSVIRRNSVFSAASAEGAQFYVDGEHLEMKGGNAKSKIDQSLEYLVAHVYSKLDLITENAGSDARSISGSFGSSG